MRKKVLFIDDDPTILLISKLMLEDLGYDFIIAEGGVIGIEMLKKSNKNNDIALILLDLMMPDICGLDVLKWIKKDQKFKHIPVILQTGVQTSNDINTARGFSNVHVLLKPYDKEDLKDMLRSCNMG
ncbi:MAG: response regulator [Gammaproteobacteria bacterium]|nr:response regulator [Gammaproteobacteria bacterium]